MSSANVSSAHTSTAPNSLYGCTCGQCVGGWLSPRMVDRLQSEAASLLLLMVHKDRAFKRHPNQTVPSKDAIMLPNAEYIPPPLYAAGLTRSFYEGYAGAFRAAFDLLSRTPTPVFTTATVRAHAEATYAHEMEGYFDNGGQVAFALDCMTDAAGDTEADNLTLPKCRNDDEFAFVRRMMGLDSDRRWGAYGVPFIVDEEREEFGDDSFFEREEDDGLDMFYLLEQRIAERRR